MTAFLFLFLGWPWPAIAAGLVWHHVDKVKAARAAEWKRLTAPLPVERITLTTPDPIVEPEPEVELVHIGRREIFVPVEVDDCDQPCTARHCRCNAPGTAAQNGGHEAQLAALLEYQVAWDTDTEEWPRVASAFGFTVPADLASLYAGSDAT